MSQGIEPNKDDEPQEARWFPAQGDIGTRIDRFLCERLDGLSRTRVQALIVEGCVCSDKGPILKSNLKISDEKWFEVELPPPLESAIEPENLPIEILYEDGDLAVVCKPPGMPTHPTTTKTTGTLVNALLYHLGDLSEIGGVLRPGIVHRLDRVTSGLLVVAKNQTSHRSLTDQFRDRKVDKTYRAICLGADPGKRGTIEGKIERDANRRQRMILGDSGRESFSEFERIESAPPLYGLFVKPKTGRTHQIRVHLESLGCPVVLDTLYGYEPKRWPVAELNPTLKEYPGVLLHAERLGFEHPHSKDRLEFNTTPPETFEVLWNRVFR